MEYAKKVQENNTKYLATLGNKPGGSTLAEDGTLLEQTQINKRQLVSTGY